MKAWISQVAGREAYHTTKQCQYWKADMHEITKEKAEQRWLDECTVCKEKRTHD